jgi:hypothetical protein
LQTYFYGTRDQAIVFSPERNGIPRAIFVKISYAHQCILHKLTCNCENLCTRPSKTQLSQSTDDFHETQPHAITALKKFYAEFRENSSNISRTIYFAKKAYTICKEALQNQAMQSRYFQRGLAKSYHRVCKIIVVVVL